MADDYGVYAAAQFRFEIRKIDPVVLANLAQANSASSRLTGASDAAV